MRFAVAGTAAFILFLPAIASAGVAESLSETSVEASLVGPAPAANLASVTQRADCNMTCDGDCCTETCCGPDGCETCKTCCPGGDCNKYCYEHKKGKKGDGKSGSAGK